MSDFCRPTTTKSSFRKMANILDSLHGLLQPYKVGRPVSLILKVRKLRHSLEVTKLINVTILVSQGCYAKVPQTWWLKTTEMYCLMVLEAESLKSRYQQGCATSGTCSEILLCVFLAFGNARCSLACRCITPTPKHTQHLSLIHI